MAGGLFLVAIILITVFREKWQSNLCAAILYLAAGLVAAYQQELVTAVIGAIGSGAFVFFASIYREKELLSKANL